MTRYFICYFCREIVCSSKNCESPNPECQEICNQVIDETNVFYRLCHECETALNWWLKNQLDKPRLRLEAHEETDS